MKSTILAVEHSSGEFTPKDGRNAGKLCKFDFQRLHVLRKCRDNIGGVETILVKCSNEQFGELVADCGGTPEMVLNRPIDMDVEKNYGKYTLKEWEVLD